jgi:hypothetical protein
MQRTPGARRVLALALSAPLVIGGCMLARMGDDGGAGGFSHRRHVEQEQLDCAMCHEDLAVADDPGLPSLDTCLLCHAELDAERADEPGVDALFRVPADGGDPVFAARRVSALDDEVVFSHLRHVAAEVACADCHRGIALAEGIGSALAVPMARCVDCHAAREQPTGCATCHSEIGPDWAPPNHALGWDRMHGKVARGAHSSLETPPAESCGLCHGEDKCASCHRIEQPRSHTNAFRVKTHGFLARMDRSSCGVCHEPASCERCHAETPPLSHTGMWGGTKAMHCLGCHTPLEQNGCAVCHRATPSHALAAPKPAWHDAAMNCTGCHGVSVQLPHVDNGENCNLWHF